MTVHVGTSGWQYRDWKGVLYADVPQRAWLERYAESFATVEVNNAFYRLPEKSTFAGWAERTPDDFRFAVKASRYLTHVRRLAGPQEPARRLMERASALGGKLGPLLLQLPPTLRADPGLLGDCLAAFPRGVQLAVEPRHSSWWHDSVRSVLADHGAALCGADRGEVAGWRGVGVLQQRPARRRGPGRGGVRAGGEPLRAAGQPCQRAGVFRLRCPRGRLGGGTCTRR